MKNRVELLVAVVVFLAVIGLLIGAGSIYLRYEVRQARKHAESAVSRSIENIRHMGALDDVNLKTITNATVDGASAEILMTNPVVFRVSAMTAWPDLMIYWYDSDSPELGVHHASF